jgi:branched-chain amino acid transport system substrate-binding protein
MAASPAAIRFAMAQSGPALKIALILPISVAQAQIGQACRRGAEVANKAFADMKIPARVEIAG